MKKFLPLIMTSAVLFSAKPLMAKEQKEVFAVVNPTAVFIDSKHGKKEQESLENFRKQMTSLMESTEKELKEISEQFEDPEFLDGLSPKAEEELKVKQQSLYEDLMRYQGQFREGIQQAQYMSWQKLSNNITKAAEKIARDEMYSYVIHKDMCFYYKPEMDITSLVIDEMDKSFETEQKNNKLSENDDSSLDIEAMFDDEISENLDEDFDESDFDFDESVR